MASSVKIPYGTPLNHSKTIPSVAGTGVVDTYGYLIKDSGKVFQKIGTHNLYNDIQEALEGTYLASMIERFTSGKASDIEFEQFKNSHIWNDVDITKMPKTLVEFEKLSLAVGQTFEKLPAELRVQFANNPHLFAQAVSDGSAFEKINNFQKQRTKSIYEKVKIQREAKEQEKKEVKKDE